MIVLRDYQMDLFTEIHAAFKRGIKGVCAVAPCGAGKTVLFSYIANLARQAGTHVVLLVHRKELLQQASKTLSNLGVPHGIISAGVTPDPTQLVQIAMVGTLARRIQSIAPPGLIIADECHHLAAGSWKNIVAAFPRAYLLGVTATPLRLDGRGLSEFFSEIIVGPTVSELTEMGFLTPAKYFCPPVGVNLKGMKKSMGDFSKSDAADRMDKPMIHGRACEHYMKICKGVPAICFCVTVDHAEHTAQTFTAAGVPAKCLHGGQSSEVRKKILDDLAGGIISVVTSCELASEGLDIPGISAAIFLRPTYSLGLYTQQAGRAVRLYPGKEVAYILDCVGNVARHGLLTDEREWSL